MTDAEKDAVIERAAKAHAASRDADGTPMPYSLTDMRAALEAVGFFEKEAQVLELVEAAKAVARIAYRDVPQFRALLAAITKAQGDRQ